MSRISAETRKALEAQKQRSIEETRQRLDQALDRIISQTPTIVPSGAKANVANVAKEAGVDRATLYRFHQPVLKRIRLGEKSTTSISLARPSNDKEYRRLVEEAQCQVQALARLNYQLQATVDELHSLLAARDRIIRDLRSGIGADAQDSSSGSVRSFVRPAADRGNAPR